MRNGSCSFLSRKFYTTSLIIAFDVCINDVLCCLSFNGLWLWFLLSLLMSVKRSIGIYSEQNTEWKIDLHEKIVHENKIMSQIFFMLCVMCA